MAVNLTNITQIDSMYDMAKYAADSSAGLFWGVVMIALFIVMVTRLRFNETENAVAASATACLFISILLLNIGFLQVLFPIVFGIILAATLFIKMFRPQ